VANAGAEYWATDWLTLLVSADQGFRAPNLDDLTSRQQTGPGFQYENAALEPEHALTLEAGARIETAAMELDGWVYTSRLDGAIARAPRVTDDCPPGTLACGNSRSQFQLVNAEGTSVIRGAETTVRLFLPGHLTARATVSYAFGDGPNPGDPPSDPSIPFEARVPLSRIPPLNGTVEILWQGESGLYLGGALRWATLQDRLAVADVSDARIPQGGTPGFAVFDVRAGVRYDPELLVSFVFENLTDAAYRYHGSSVNGPARGFLINLETGL
jgi:iron complex outermembrane receptor protein/hemoglobin/transferrin/lactoferrin receptor protein